MPPPLRDVSSSPRKYLEPDFVLTTVLLLTSPTIAEVVTGSPSLNALDPLMKPEILFSLGSSFHFEIVGTPRGALATGAVFAMIGASGGVSLVAAGAPPPIPNNEKVGRPLTGGTSTISGFFFGGAFFAAGGIFGIDRVAVFFGGSLLEVTRAVSSSFLGNNAPALSAISAFFASRR